MILKCINNGKMIKNKDLVQKKVLIVKIFFLKVIIIKIKNNNLDYKYLIIITFMDILIMINFNKDFYIQVNKK